MPASISPASLVILNLVSRVRREGQRVSPPGWRRPPGRRRALPDRRAFRSSRSSGPTIASSRGRAPTTTAAWSSSKAPRPAVADGSTLTDEHLVGRTSAAERTRTPGRPRPSSPPGPEPKRRHASYLVCDPPTRTRRGAARPPGPEVRATSRRARPAGRAEHTFPPDDLPPADARGARTQRGGAGSPVVAGWVAAGRRERVDGAVGPDGDQSRRRRAHPAAGRAQPPVRPRRARIP